MRRDFAQSRKGSTKRKNGAPEEIRTPDPQIRSLTLVIDCSEIFYKPAFTLLRRNQGVAPVLQTECCSHNPVF
jgi:hypothetical protein